MACGTPLCFFKPVLAVAAVAAVGMGGYNFATTGCVLGSCDSKAADTTLTAVSDSKAPKSGCCPSEREAEATAMLASQDTTDACPEAMRQACETMGECPEGMMEHCQTEGECPMAAQAAQTSLVSDVKTEGECEAKTECEKACDGAPKPACHEADQTAEAETGTETSEG